LLDLAVLKLKLSKYSIGASSPKTVEREMIRNDTDEHWVWIRVRGIKYLILIYIIHGIY
jgi:hypothetical protein